MKLQRIKTYIILITLFTCIRTFALDPRVDYQKISSEHFDIIYDAKSYELAKVYLQEAERSYQILVDIFGTAPKKTVVTLDDTVDIANGSATGVPRPAVNIFINPPTSLATIDYYSFWPRDVFLHEYTHILNMEPALGVWKPFRFVFGSFVRPNMFLPRWYLEGLAVEMESRYNDFGRLKSTDYDALIRAFYLDSKWGEDNLSAINESSTPYWPAGQRPYFYGALMWHELVQSKSISIIRTFNERYARRVPWAITQPMVDEFGKTYEDFLKGVYKKYAALTQKQLLQLQEGEVTKSVSIMNRNDMIDHSPTLSPDGQKLAFISQNLNGDVFVLIGERLNGVWTIYKDDKKNPFEDKKYEPVRVSWFPNSKKLIYDAAGKFDHTNLYYDLYTFDLEKNEKKQLTHGLRAREASVSPDGKTIVFVKGGGGKTALYTVDSEGKNPTLTYAPQGYARVSSPTYLNDKKIVFSEKDRTGFDKIHILNTETKAMKIFEGTKNSKNPVVTSKGIVFTSNQSGVENLYITSIDFKTTLPLTSTLTRVLNGTFDPQANKVIFTELTGNGPQLKEADPTKNMVLPPVIHPIANDFPDKVVEESPKLEPKAKSYSAFPYMFPQFWMPFVTFAVDGVITTVTIPGSDPTGFHSYLLSGTYDSRPEKFSGYFSYMWQNYIGQMTLSVSNYYKWYSSLKDSANTQEIGLYQSFFVPGLSDDWKAKLGYEYKKLNVLEDVGFGAEKRNHYFDGLSVGMTYNNMDQGNVDISPSGQMAKVRYTHFFENSTHTNFDETFIKLADFHSKWLPKRHVLAVTAQGSITERNRNILLGTTTTETEFTLGPLSDGFVTRGYPAGEFIGYTLASAMLEYRFPISEKWHGPDSPTPYFLKRLHGTIFAETITVDGVYFNETEHAKRSNLGKYYTSAGVELKADSTLFYHVPVTLKFVVANGFESKANGGLNYYFTIMAPELF